MIKTVIYTNLDGEKVGIEKFEADPICGKDLCLNCGHCISCYDCCYGDPEQNIDHKWVVYERKE